MFTRKEINWVIRFSIFVIILTTIPYLIGYFVQDSHWAFSGFLFGVEDGNSYIAKMLSGAYGNWLFKTPYTTVAQNGFLAFFPYILLGKLTSNPGQHEQLIALFQIYRCAGIIFLCLTSYQFISLFLSKPFYRKLVLFISIFGGGLGWLGMFFLKDLPLEMYSPETFGFLSVFGLPHLLFSKALLLWGLTIFFGQERNIKNTLITGLLWFLIGFFQPLTITIGWFILSAYLLIGLIRVLTSKVNSSLKPWWNEAKQIILIGLLSSPWVMYNLISFQTDPYLKGWYSQNIILSPNPLDYLISLGLIVPVAIWGCYLLIKNNSKLGFLAAGWFIAFPFMIYFPIIVQRRMAEGFWTILIILFFIPFMDKKVKWIWPMVICIPLLISTLILYIGASNAALNKQGPIFISQTEVEAFKLIRETATPWDVVMAPYDISNALPAWAPVRVIAGHGPESVYLNQVTADFNRFNQTHDETVKESLLNQYHVKYILTNIQDLSLELNKRFIRIFSHLDTSIYLYHEYGQ